MKKYLAELLGTFVLTFFGCGSAAIAGVDLGNLGIAFACSLSIVAMAYATGNVSGCQEDADCAVVFPSCCKEAYAPYFVNKQYEKELIKESPANRKNARKFPDAQEAISAERKRPA